MISSIVTCDKCGRTIKQYWSFEITYQSNWEKTMQYCSPCYDLYMKWVKGNLK